MVAGNWDMVGRGLETMERKGFIFVGENRTYIKYTVDASHGTRTPGYFPPSPISASIIPALHHLIGITFVTPEQFHHTGTINEPRTH